VEVFKTELQLVVIQPLGAPTKLAALQLLNDEPEAFDLRLRLSEVGAVGRERPDHPPQRLDIVWQIGKIGDDGHFIGYEPLVCPDDADAIEKAKRLRDGHDLELWSGPRFIIRLEWPKRNGPSLGGQAGAGNCG
jgi:hypothetical protein